MAKVIVISQVPLPFSKIGSWTTLYNNYITTSNTISIIVCPEPKTFYPSIIYSIVREKTIDKLRRKLLKRNKTEVLSALNKVINHNDKFIIQLIDNYGLVKPLHDYLVAKGSRENFYLQFFYHGFDPYLQADSTENFYSLIDEITLLTKASYSEFRENVAILPKHISILYNGIDTRKFRVISDLEKIKIKQKIGVSQKKVFLWCSQDRPKKGLNLVLEAWSQIYSHDKDIILLVIGCEPRAEIPGVQFLGKIPNDELPKYYQIADCYLFSTLCNEGFGMSLIEALHCGCYSIASKLGGVPEVLQNGKYGKLIEKPHSVSEWVNAINEFLESTYSYPILPKDLYSMETWNSEMSTIIAAAKERVENPSRLKSNENNSNNSCEGKF